MDQFDYRILEYLQKDASISIAELADAVGLSTTPCWRRIQRMKKEGIIKSQVVLCDPEKLDLSLTAFVTVKLPRHEESVMRTFLDGVSAVPEIVEVYRMAGEIDYLLKIVLADMKDYDRVYRRLIKVSDMRDVSASFVMEIVEHTTALPLPGGSRGTA